MKTSKLELKKKVVVMLSSKKPGALKTDNHKHLLTTTLTVTETFLQGF